METKIIFLDHDGVMVTDNDFAIKKSNRFDAMPFSRTAVSVLNEIIFETGAEIVVSSDWKYYFSLDRMREWYVVNGVCKLPIGFTASSPNYTGDKLGRSEEILSWVKLHRVRRWVAIDDLDMSPYLRGHFVHCNRHYEGIRKQGVKEKVIEAMALKDEWLEGRVSDNFFI